MPKTIEITPAVPEASTSTRPYVIAGLALVLATFGGVGTWAALAPLWGAVIAPGVVTLQSSIKTIQHLEGGIVSAIYVKDGDYVESGQPLIQLDDTRARANLMIIESQLDLLRAREARLLAERDGQAKISFSERLDGRAKEPKIADILDGQRQLFAARRTSLRGEIEILHQRVTQYEKEIAGIDAQIEAQERQIEIVQLDLADQRHLHAKGYTTLTRVRELERSVQQLKGLLGEYRADVARAGNSIGDARLRIIQLERDFREDVVVELHEIQAEVFSVAERHTAALDEVRRLAIRAPRAGTVVGLGVHTIGGVVAPGEPALQIVPADDPLVVDAHIEPRDIDKVHVGQQAIVRLTAFDLRTTPELSADVITVSADRLLDPVNGSPYYLVRTRIPDTEVAKLGELELLPGMPADTFIQTGSRTVLSYMLKPFNDGLKRAFRDQ